AYQTRKVNPKKGGLPKKPLTARQSYEKSNNRKAERLRFADSAAHRLATLHGGEAGLDRHVDVLAEELHRSIAQQEQAPVGMIAAEVTQASDRGIGVREG